MQSTAKLDKTNRIVITRPMRELIGAKPGQTLIIQASPGLLVISTKHVPARLVKKGKLKVIDCPLPDVSVAEAVDEARHYFR